MKEIEFEQQKKREKQEREAWQQIDELVDTCLLYTSDAADE